MPLRVSLSSVAHTAVEVDSRYTEGALVKTSAIRVLVFLEAHSITGPAKVMVELAREARRNDGATPQIEIVVATFLRGESENSFTRAMHAEGIPIEAVRERSALDPGVLLQMREIVKRIQPDIVWTNAVKSHFLVRVAGLDKHAHWVASHHGYTTTDLKTRLYNALDRWSHRGAERVITVCHKFARDLEERGVRPDRIRVQHSPIRQSEAVSAGAVDELRRTLDLAPGTRVILSVGRLSLEKGHADLIRAFALACSRSAEPLQLVIVGAGPELHHLEALAKALSIRDRTSFVGQRADVQPYYDLADAFVLPSYSEGSPNVLLEAMNAGVPVVATDVGGVPEIVTDDASALLVGAHDSEAMAGAMLRLMNDDALRARLTASAREVLTRHTPETYYRELRGILEELVRR